MREPIPDETADSVFIAVVPRWQERNLSNHNNNRLRVRLNRSGSDEGEEVFDDAFEVRKGLAFPLRRALTCSVGCDFPRSTTRQTSWFYLVPKKTEILGVRWADSMLAVRVPGRTAVISPR